MYSCKQKFSYRFRKGAHECVIWAKKDLVMFLKTILQLNYYNYALLLRENTATGLILDWKLIILETMALNTTSYISL